MAEDRVTVDEAARTSLSEKNTRLQCAIGDQALLGLTWWLHCPRRTAKHRSGVRSHRPIPCTFLGSYTTSAHNGDERTRR
jgi:hypothetical protein